MATFVWAKTASSPLSLCLVPLSSVVAFILAAHSASRDEELMEHCLAILATNLMGPAGELVREGPEGSS